MLLPKFGVDPRRFSDFPSLAAPAWPNKRYSAALTALRALASRLLFGVMPPCLIGSAAGDGCRGSTQLGSGPGITDCIRTRCTPGPTDQTPKDQAIGLICTGPFKEAFDWPSAESRSPRSGFRASEPLALLQGRTSLAQSSTSKGVGWISRFYLPQPNRTGIIGFAL